LSALPYEQNVSETAALTRMAHEVGVSVEAELGVIGGGGEGNYTPSVSNSDYFTDPDQAADFVQSTNVDALAVSVGNVHGFYRGEPQLDFKLIECLRQAVPVPLVLHGGSGISDDDFRRAISLGISKINFFTGISRGAVEKVTELLANQEQSLGFEALMQGVGESVTNVVAQRMRVFGSSGKA
jgi:fructose-bisphosphate aldolase, class II